jgi:dTDP-4-dehydrorhamnose reductase
MKVLILGTTGMLGHKLMQVLGGRFDVTGTVRKDATFYAEHPILREMQLVGGVEAERFDTIVGALAHTQPAVVINCIGIIKQLPAGKEPLLSIAINALFPHRLAQLCRVAGARLIHISTDCVFSGRKGNYIETDVSDAEDLYGKTKFLGEVAYPGCLTLRTSIIGRELNTQLGLIEWFIGQRGGQASGYTKAIYTGFTTQILAELIADILVKHPDLNGLWHVSSDPISKFDLLNLVNEAFDLKITIEPNETFVCDRSLNSDRFRQTTGFVPPDWVQMVAVMANESVLYDSIKR